MANEWDDFPSDDLGGTATAPAATVLYKEACKSCGGTGRYHGKSSHGNKCFTCKGVGYHEYKTSPQYRADQRAKGAASRAKKKESAQAAWKAANPAAAHWVATDGGNFAASLRNSLEQYGSLTPNQTAAVLRSIEGQKQAKAAAAARQADAKDVSVSKMLEAFETARKNGLKAPKLRFLGCVFKPAKQHPGVLYVTDKPGYEEGTYLGKIADGKFIRSRECTLEQEKVVLAVCLDPASAARVYGREVGSCCVCGRELTDPGSIAEGIGPICSAKAGW